MKKVLVVAVHPDDETLAAGGTLLRHIAEGDEVYWLIVTGMTKELGYSHKVLEKREEEIQAVHDKFGFKQTIRFDLPTTRLDELPMGDIIAKFSKCFRDVEPNIVYLPFKSDVHSDHGVSFQAAFACTKSFRYPSIEKVFMMETISETDFAPALVESAYLPNHYVNISPYLEKKNEILAIFESEMHDHPFPRSFRNIEALATYRGAQAGVEYAEAFMLLKEIMK